MYGSCSYGLLWGSHTLYALKISDLAKFLPFKTKNLAIFFQNCLFWEFLTYDFQTWLWIFLSFGMELLWILTLSGEPIILCLVMREFHLVSQESLKSFFTGQALLCMFYHFISHPKEQCDIKWFYCKKNQNKYHMAINFRGS